MIHMRIVLYILLVLFIASIASFIYALIRIVRRPRSIGAWLIFITALVLVSVEIFIFRMAHLWL